MSEYIDSEMVNEVISLLIHEYNTNYYTYKRVFGQLASPNMGPRAEAIYPHKMHDVVLQVLSSKGVVVKNITRPITNAVLRQIGLDPQRTSSIELNEFLNHVKPKHITFPFNKPSQKNNNNNKNSESSNNQGKNANQSKNERYPSTRSNPSNSRQIKKKMSGIPVPQSQQSFPFADGDASQSTAKGQYSAAENRHRSQSRGDQSRGKSVNGRAPSTRAARRDTTEDGRGLSRTSRRSSLERTENHRSSRAQSSRGSRKPPQSSREGTSGGPRPRTQASSRNVEPYSSKRQDNSVHDSSSKHAEKSQSRDPASIREIGSSVFGGAHAEKCGLDAHNSSPSAVVGDSILGDTVKVIHPQRLRVQSVCGEHGDSLPLCRDTQPQRPAAAVDREEETPEKREKKSPSEQFEQFGNQPIRNEQQETASQTLLTMELFTTNWRKEENLKNGKQHIINDAVKDTEPEVPHVSKVLQRDESKKVLQQEKVKTSSSKVLAAGSEQRQFGSGGGGPVSCEWRGEQEEKEVYANLKRDIQEKYRHDKGAHSRRNTTHLPSSHNGRRPHGRGDEETTQHQGGGKAPDLGGEGARVKKSHRSRSRHKNNNNNSHTERLADNYKYQTHQTLTTDFDESDKSNPVYENFSKTDRGPSLKRTPPNKSVNNSSHNTDSTGETLKQILLKKLIPWKRQSCTSLNVPLSEHRTSSSYNTGGSGRHSSIGGNQVTIPPPASRGRSGGSSSVLNIPKHLDSQKT